jgi:ABC-type dipeptide/oligopeptide/nickel transport system permease subunit
MPPACLHLKNLYDQTPQDIFRRNHEYLQREGEKWMNTTANNCMLVATLIVTVVFAAIFTVPGGNHQDFGIPILLKSKWFTVFFVSDVIALSFASTSILIFLSSILTSRYKEEDFLESLPKRLAFGLAALYISIVGMMVAFGATCILVYKWKATWIPFVIIAVAVLPILLFGRLINDFLLHIFSSTLCCTSLFGPRKHGLFQQKVAVDPNKIDNQ